MPVTPKQKTALAIVLGALVTIAPSFFTYLQARQEIREKYHQTHTEASNGYDALAASVKDLQNTLLEQHDYIVKLQGQVALLTAFLSSGSPSLRMGSGSGSAAVANLPETPTPPNLKPLPAPPADFDVAQHELR